MLVHGDMIYPPLQALQSLARFQRLGTGDLVMTGTPVGTALGAPPKPPEVQAFLKREASNPKYLQHGDILEVSIATNDGAIDLGTQRTAVRYG
jgi:2-keto-4-pentenoate hydratase/2-oxohepta-3-ene-1,7-dioic acid hydratase in catechol pathway